MRALPNKLLLSFFLASVASSSTYLPSQSWNAEPEIAPLYFAQPGLEDFYRGSRAMQPIVRLGHYFSRTDKLHLWVAWSFDKLQRTDAFRIPSQNVFILIPGCFQRRQCSRCFLRLQQYLRQCVSMRRSWSPFLQCFCWHTLSLTSSRRLDWSLLVSSIWIFSVLMDLLVVWLRLLPVLYLLQTVGVSPSYRRHAFSNLVANNFFQQIWNYDYFWNGHYHSLLSFHAYWGLGSVSSGFQNSFSFQLICCFFFVSSHLLLHFYWAAYFHISLNKFCIFRLRLNW